MARRLPPGARLVIATHNPGKLREIAALLAPHGVAAVSAGELGLPEPDETEDSFAGNARLKAIARECGLILLIGRDAELAARIGADGVHLPERLAYRARRLKAAHPRWIVTAAAHSTMAARRALAAGADAVVVSTVFASRSASAGRPMGAVRLALLVRRVNGPVYGLGGIDNKKARLLKDTGLVGLAAVDGFKA